MRHCVLVFVSVGVLLFGLGGVGSAQSPSTDGVGTGSLQYTGCTLPDAVGFTARDNGDGTWTFTASDVGLAECVFFHSDDLRGTGSFTTGFTGPNVVSPPWDCRGNVCQTSDLTFSYPANSGIGMVAGAYSITGSAFILLPGGAAASMPR